MSRVKKATVGAAALACLGAGFTTAAPVSAAPVSAAPAAAVVAPTSKTEVVSGVARCDPTGYSNNLHNAAMVKFTYTKTYIPKSVVYRLVYAKPIAGWNTLGRKVTRAERVRGERDGAITPFRQPYLKRTYQRMLGFRIDWAWSRTVPQNRCWVHLVANP